MPETTNLAKRLKEQKQRESAITQDLMKHQLDAMRKELTSTLQSELNTIKADIHAQSQSISWSAFKSRILWPTLIGLSLCLGIFGGSWGGMHYFGNQAMEMRRSIQIMEREGGKIQWNRCGDDRRLCVKIDQKAPAWGKDSEWRILEGY